MTPMYYILAALLSPLYLAIGIFVARKLRHLHQDPGVLSPITDTLLWPAVLAVIAVVFIVMGVGFMLFMGGAYVLVKVRDGLGWLNKKILGEEQ